MKVYVLKSWYSELDKEDHIIDHQKDSMVIIENLETANANFDLIRDMQEKRRGQGCFIGAVVLFQAEVTSEGTVTNCSVDDRNIREYQYSYGRSYK